MIQIAIMGHGIVGSGVAEVLLKNAVSIARKAGDSIEVKRILDLRTFPDSPFADRFTTDFGDILHDESIRIVVETMGGLKPAYEYVKQCMMAGKSVVSSNKELVAAKGDELLEIARDYNVNFMFEASVGGGIPILRPLDQCLAANEVYEIAGILNGTTNYVLTKMIHEGMSFDDALALAQKLGYAERNPAADVEGHDACRKICILASLAFGKHVYPEQVHTEGIASITSADVHYAEAWGGVIKLIGRAKRDENDKLYCIVSPMILPRSSKLAEVDDVFNGILVRGDAIGDVVFYGRGAGKLPTASAVVADVIDEARHLKDRKSLFWERGDEDYIHDYMDLESPYYLRVSGDVALAEQLLTRELGACTRITLEEAEGEAVQGEEGRECAFFTPSVKESRMAEVVELFTATGLVVENRLRVAE